MFPDRLELREAVLLCLFVRLLEILGVLMIFLKENGNQLILALNVSGAVGSLIFVAALILIPLPAHFPNSFVFLNEMPNRAKPPMNHSFEVIR